MTHAEQKLLDLLPQVATSFFAVFSRFEYALKRSGYLKKSDAGNSKKAGSGEKAEVDWNKFAKSLKTKSFFDKIKVTGKAKTLIETPPKRQINRNGTLDWAPVTKVTTDQDLFGAVCRVRNNLFHGGKFHSGTAYDTARDEILLNESLWVLKQALEQDEDVCRHFNDPIPS